MGFCCIWKYIETFTIQFGHHLKYTPSNHYNMRKIGVILVQYNGKQGTNTHKTVQYVKMEHLRLIHMGIWKRKLM